MCERILIIDNDPNLLKILAAALTFSDYQVMPAADSLEGLIQASREGFDLIITGKIMPVMNGSEFVQELARLIYQPPPVIMLTGDTSPVEAAPASPVKVTCFKPISLFSLLEVVKCVLNSNLTTTSAS